MNDSILNKAREFLEGKSLDIAEAHETIDDLLNIYDMLNERYLELIYTPTGIACDERHAHALKTLEQAND